MFRQIMFNLKIKSSVKFSESKKCKIQRIKGNGFSFMCCGEGGRIVLLLCDLDVKIISFLRVFPIQSVIFNYFLYT